MKCKHCGAGEGNLDGNGLETGVRCLLCGWDSSVDVLRAGASARRLHGNARRTAEADRLDGLTTPLIPKPSQKVQWSDYGPVLVDTWKPPRERVDS